jgi:peptidoglycan/LPS O-acetylase OafA/YrhL
MADGEAGPSGFESGPPDALRLHAASRFDLLRDSWSNVQLRRIVTSNRFIPEVDGFRFLAILIVITSHVFNQCGPIPGHGLFMDLFRRGFVGSVQGYKGVYLFFTISGFILSMPFARHHLQGGNRVRLGSYFRRRLTRLEPPYVLAMLMRFPLVLMAKQVAVLTLFLHLLASIFYVHNLVFGVPSTVNPPAWSLEVEIQFYLVAPLLAYVFVISQKHWRRAILAGGLLAGGVLSAALRGHGGVLPLTLAGNIQYFLAGFLLCDFYLTGDVWKVPPWMWDGAAVAALFWMLYTKAAWFPILFPFATMLLYFAGFYGSAARAFFAFRPISLIGGMCYSIYLTHTTILSGVAHVTSRLFHSSLGPGLQAGLTFVLSYMCSLLGGMVYFVLIERPCMDPNWPHKLAARLGWSKALRLAEDYVSGS